MKRGFIKTVSCCLIVKLSLVSATSAQAMTFREALALTYQNNPEINAQRASVKSTSELIPQALSGWFRPAISATVTGSLSREFETENKTGSTTSRVKIKEDIRDLTSEVDLTLDLYNGGSTAADIRYARASYLVARATLEYTEQTVMARAAKRYLDVIKAKRKYAITEERVGELEAVHDRIEAMFANQLATVADRANVAVEIATTKATLETRQSTLNSARAAFEETVGVLPDGIDVEVWPLLVNYEADLEKALKIAEEKNPQVVGAENEIQANQASVESERGELLPTVTFYATASKENNNARAYGTSNLRDHTMLDDFTVGLELSVPIYSGGSRSSSIRAARMGLKESKFDAMNTRRSIQNSVRDAWFDLEGSAAAVERGTVRLENAQILLNGREREFDRRTITVDKLVDAHVAVHSAQEYLIDQEYNHLVAQIDLMTAEGLFSVSNLDLDITPVDVDGYARNVEANSWIPWSLYSPE